jgi:transcriptional regulator with XRE-family HTH domain
MGKLWELLQRHIDGEKYPPSERQVAARLGVSPSTLGGWRDLRRLPSRETLQAIADLVGVRYAVVLDAALRDTGYHEATVVVPMRRRSTSTIEAELQVAAQDLEAFDELTVTGSAAESKRDALAARVDALQRELVASRSATVDSDSVAEL